MKTKLWNVPLILLLIGGLFLSSVGTVQADAQENFISITTSENFTLLDYVLENTEVGTQSVAEVNFWEVEPQSVEESLLADLIKVEMEAFDALVALDQRLETEKLNPGMRNRLEKQRERLWNDWVAKKEASVELMYKLGFGDNHAHDEDEYDHLHIVEQRDQLHMAEHFAKLEQRAHKAGHADAHHDHDHHSHHDDVHGLDFAPMNNYPISMTVSQLRNQTFNIYLYNNNTGTFSYYTLGGNDFLATGLQVYEHASYSSSLGRLFTHNVLVSTRYLQAWTNMRNEKGPIPVLSGFRNVHHNWSISGAAMYSQHQAGIGVDPVVPVGQENQWVYAAQTRWGFTYAYSKTGAIHADTRSTVSGFPLVRPGDQNEYVYVMKEGINLHGYNLPMSGFYSSSDSNIVKLFQRDHSLSQDGLVGSQTWGKILTRDSHTP